MSRIFWFLTAGLGALAWAQDAQPDRVTMPFRDASKPRTLVVNVPNGNITIRGYEGNDAIIEGNTNSDGAPRTRIRSSQPPPGMHRIGETGTGLDVTEENNVVTVRSGFTRRVDLLIQVPVQTSLNLKTLNGRSVVVENISGEIEAENMNGSVTMTNVSGSVLANSMNGRITVSLDRVTPGKSMSFSTMNGAVDVTLPADIKARLKMKTDNGDIYVDDGFDVKIEGGATPQTDDQRKSGGRYRIRLDRTTYGSINGGGPEIQFTTYNGSIMIHKK
jgi:hypothetical protein